MILPFPQSPRPSAAAGAAAQPATDAVVTALYDAHASAIYKFIYYKVGNREDAEDLTEQVFLKAILHLDQERDAASMLAWLYQVARTTITDHWRTHYEASLSSLEVLQDEHGFQWADEERAIAPEDTPAATQIAAILTALPENYRRVLELRFLRGYSLRETAAEMGITEGNVKVLQYRALQKAGKLPTQAQPAPPRPAQHRGLGRQVA